jgi:hypothetical protein
MPQPYYAAKKSLAIPNAHIAAWEGMLRLSPDLDEFGKNVGTVVCANLRKDGMIGTRGMASLLRRALFAPSGSLANFAASPAAIDAYVASCHKPQHQRLGYPATIPNGVLWHVMTEDQLRESVNVSTYQPRPAYSPAWVAFRDACIANRTADAYSIIGTNGIALHPKGFQVFATFEQSSGPGGGNPDGWDATQACAALGLSKDWPAYAPGQLLWMIKYKYVAQLDKVAVPTVSDADWRSIFVPSARRNGTQHGIALPLGPFLEHTPAMPEVVHRGATLYPVIPAGSGPGCSELVGHPRLLGRTTGW